LAIRSERSSASGRRGHERPDSFALARSVEHESDAELFARIAEYQHLEERTGALTDMAARMARGEQSR